MSLVQQGRSPTQATVDGTLLDQQGGNTNGVWQRLDRIVPWSLTVRGSFTATITIFVSNMTTAPANNDNFQAVFQSTTTTMATGSTLPYRWIKAQVTNWASGQITVDLCGGA